MEKEDNETVMTYDFMRLTTFLHNLNSIVAG